MKSNGKNLSHIFSDVENTLYSLVERSANLSSDTRQLEPGDVFLAYPVGFGQGFSDNREHIPKALSKGVSLVLYDSEHWSESELLSARAVLGDVRCVAVPNLSVLVSEICSRWYGHPSADLEVIGVTGTNGKTTITNWLAQAFGKSYATAVMGTLGYGGIDQLTTTGFTTPDAPRVQRNLAELRQNQFKTLAMEVSSHALDQGRVTAVQFDTVIFSNLTQDHLDYHHSMAEYGAAKFSLFRRADLKNMIINIDDPVGLSWIEQLFLHTKARIWVYGSAQSFAKLTPDQQTGCLPVLFELKEMTHAGTHLKIHTTAKNFNVLVPSMGSFNMHNALAVIATLLAYDLPIEKIIKNIEQLKPVPGRMEAINLGDKNNALTIVDFAHTPDALAKTMQALLPIASQRGGELVCVFGCGGNRDRSKRAQMGRIATELAAKVIVTNDNPRNEDPGQIIEDILQGVAKEHQSKVIIQEDRAFAILSAVKSAKIQDVILIAGKGHENTQEVMGNQFPFSDQDHLRLALRRIA